MIISTIVALIFEYFRLKSAKAVMDSFMLFFEGMGKQFVLVVSLIVCGEVFANGLLHIGAVDTMITAAQNAGFGVGSMIVVMSFIHGTCCFLDGVWQRCIFLFRSPHPKNSGLSKSGCSHAHFTNANHDEFWPNSSPITAAIVAISGIAGVSPFQVVKRTAIPMGVAAIVNLIMTFIYLG